MAETPTFRNILVEIEDAKARLEGLEEEIRSLGELAREAASDEFIGPWRGTDSTAPSLEALAFLRSSLPQGYINLNTVRDAMVLLGFQRMYSSGFLVSLLKKYPDTVRYTKDGLPEIEFSKLVDKIS